MFCVKCSQHLVLCECSDVTERLTGLTKSENLYVGNIIEARYRNGRSNPSQFAGIDIHYPLTKAEEKKQ